MHVVVGEGLEKVVSLDFNAALGVMSYEITC